MLKRNRTLPACLLAACLLGSINTYALEPTDLIPDGMFHLVDFETGEIMDGAYDSFRTAKGVYNNIKEDYVNLGIVKDGITYEAEYALALFHVNDACDFEVTYTNTSDGTEGNVNGCYGVDAAYLYTDDEGQKVTFSLSGVTAQASIEDVTVIPLQNVYVNLSMYTVRNGNLYHMIKGEMDDDYYGYIVDHGEAPEYLEEGRAYYSYDGHYFYGDDMLYGMLDDYRNGIRDNSVNPENAWYNWYQFVSHRTISKATRDDISTYLTETMGLTGPIDRFLDTDKDGTGDILNQSQLYGTEEAFLQAQYEFGANALMMLAISEMESSIGRRSLSYTRNNLYAHAAYDSEEEAELGRYSDIRTSIYSHAKYYLSGSYLSPMKEQYNGGFFGNLSAGMNVRYSSDPYWGEKAAAAYRALDETMGLNEGESVQLGIRTVENETIVYKDASSETPLYTTGEMPDMAFVIIGEEENDDGSWYLIQSDATLDEDRAVDLSYYYDWNRDTAYIKQDAVQVILGERREVPEYVSVTFDSDGGTFLGKEDSVSYQLPKGSDGVVVSPVKADADFTGFDMDTKALDADISFTAQYRNVVSLDITSLPKTDYERNDRIELRGGILHAAFEDGSGEDRPLSTNMVSGFDMKEDGDQMVSVSAYGKNTTYTIHVSGEKDDARAAMKERILALIDRYGSDEEELSDADLEEILSVKHDMDSTVQPYLTMPELRSYDTILRKAYQDKIRYVIDDGGNFGFGVSGLSVSIPLEEGQLEKAGTEADTYRMSINEGIHKDAEEALAKEAEYLGETVLRSFTLNLEKNMENIDPDSVLLCTISRPNDSVGGDVYTVLSRTKDGDIVKCYTRQTTNTISFMTSGPGEFILTTRNTSNQYVGEDPVEAVTSETSSLDIRAILSRVALGTIFLIIIVFGSMYILGKRRRKKNQAKHEEKRKVIKHESENLEVTQALEILNTEMLRLDEIRKAEEEAKQNDQFNRKP